MKLECFYVVLSSGTAFAYALIPYNEYGPAGAWCWIKTLNENCSTTLPSLLDQIFMSYVFDVSSGVIGAILLVSMAVVYCRLSNTLQEARTLLKKTSAVIVCFLLYVAAIVFNLITHTITTKDDFYKNVSIWLSFAILYPSGSLFFPMGFILCFYPVKNIFKSTLCAKMKKYFCIPCETRRKRTVHLQHELTSSMSASLPVSSRVSPLSHTYFQAPYTNNFTHVTNEHASLLNEDKRYETTIEYLVLKMEESL